MEPIFRKKNRELMLMEIEQDKRLVEASRSGELDQVKTLLKTGASPDATEYNKSLFYDSKNYLTPLMIAASQGYTDVVRCLIESGASVNASDRFDVSALHMAADEGHVDCVAMLLENDAMCNNGTKYSKHGSYTAFPHPGGTTPLHLAASANNIECVTMLIWHGADYNAVDEYGRTSLYIAAQKSLEECVHAHLDNAIWKDILSLPAKDTGDTPLHECVKNGMLSCIQALLRKGSDVNHKNLQGFRFSPLHYVCFHENNMQERRPEAAALLISYGASFNIRNRNNDSLLQYELRSKNRDLTILFAIAKSVAYLPTIESLSIFPPHSQLISTDYSANRHMVKLIKNDVQYYKIMWYKELTRDPRSLQHYCRCVVRKAMGVRRLGQIDTLPLPSTLKDYLHLRMEEFSVSIPEMPDT
uniref:Uncharacterized protein n=1 Tax=Magallana gigas TaxID=29159 RepID=K1Q898_MAGGI